MPFRWWKALKSYRLRKGVEQQKMMDEAEELAVTAAAAVAEASRPSSAVSLPPKE